MSDIDPKQSKTINLMVAFDHRASLRRHLGTIPNASTDLVRLKRPIWRAAASVAADVWSDEAEVTTLVDRSTAKALAGEEHALPLAVAIETSGSELIQLEAEASALVDDLVAVNARWAKVLLRWHPEATQEAREMQGQVLQEAAHVAERAGCELLVEVLVAPSATDLAILGGNASVYPDLVRPMRIAQALTQIGAYADPHLWKIEEVTDRRWCSVLSDMVGRAASPADIVTLGGGRSAEELRSGFAASGSAERFRGFAIGRTVWRSSLDKLAVGEIDAASAEREIGIQIGRLIETYGAATGVRLSR